MRQEHLTRVGKSSLKLFFSVRFKEVPPTQINHLIFRPTATLFIEISLFKFYRCLKPIRLKIKLIFPIFCSLKSPFPQSPI